MFISLRVLLVLLCISLIPGCYEDVAEITLNPDGSGTIKHKLILSERLVVATSDDPGRRNIPPATKEKVLEEIGSAIDIISIKQTDLRDGKRIIEFEGTFNTPEQLFLSDFCRDTLKLRLAPAGEDKAAIYCDMGKSGAGGMNLTRMYGAAKGLYIKRMVHLPTEIEKTNGYYDKVSNMVSWDTDLRDKHGLAKTKVFVEGPDQGKGYVVFDASTLKFALPLKVLASQQKTAEEENFQKQPTGLTAKVAWISVQRATKADGTDMPDKSYTEIGVELSWNEGFHPVRCEEPILLTLLDYNDNDLITGQEQPFMQLKISSRHQKKKELRLRAKVPSQNSRKLRNLEGYVKVVSDVATEVVILEDIKSLIGKDSTGNPTLDKLNFKVAGIRGHSLTIKIDGGDNTIVSLAIIKDDGSRIKKIGSFGGGNEYSYDFKEDISGLTKCELEVVVSKKIEKVPFGLEEMLLP